MTARGGRRAPLDSDALAMRRASWAVGVQIAIASGALAIAAIGAAYFFILDQLRPDELTEAARPGEHKIYIDANEAMVAFVVLGVLAVLIAGALSLLLTRRAVSPLGRALGVQRTFVQDASHELRTPLAVLDARLQILQRGLEPGDPSIAVVADLRRDTRTLIDVVTDLLLAAEGAAERTPPVADPVAPAVTNAVEGMRMLADQRRITIGLTIQDDLPKISTVPASSLQRCVTALLDNAVAHSPDGAAVRVTVTREEGATVIAVSDEGAGIQGIDPRRIFDRFAHAEPAASEDGPPARAGFGIGLALVRDVATRHGGTVGVVSTGARGTTLALRLPRGG